MVITLDSTMSEAGLWDRDLQGTFNSHKDPFRLPMFASRYWVSCVFMLIDDSMDTSCDQRPCPQTRSGQHGNVREPGNPDHDIDIALSLGHN